jgi:hypothetical protein
MEITVNDLLERLRGDMDGINHRTFVHSLRSVINATQTRLLGLITPISSIRTVNIENGVFGNETYFEAPADMSQDNVINISKCKKDMCECCVIWERSKDYDVKTNKYHKFDVEYSNGYKYIRLQTDINRCNPCSPNAENCKQSFDSLTGNGHWDIYGGITNLEIDTQNKMVGAGSMVISTRTDGYMVNPNQKLIVEPKDNESMTVWAHINKPHRIRSIIHTLGDLTNGVEYIAQSRHNGSTFIQGWNLLKFTRNKVIGNPADSFTSSVWKINLVNGINDPCLPKDGCEVDCAPVVVKLSCLSYRDTTCFSIKYYSTYMFRNPLTGNFTSKISDVTKQGEYIINLDEQAFEIFYELLHRRLKFQKKNENNESEISFITGELSGLISSYNKKHPSYVKRPVIKNQSFRNEMNETFNL